MLGAWVLVYDPDGLQNPPAPLYEGANLKLQSGSQGSLAPSVSADSKASESEERYPQWLLGPTKSALYASVVCLVWGKIESFYAEVYLRSEISRGFVLRC